MKSSITTKIILASLSVALLGCAQKKKTQAHEVTSLPVSDAKVIAKARYAIAPKPNNPKPAEPTPPVNTEDASKNKEGTPPATENKENENKNNNDVKDGQNGKPKEEIKKPPVVVEANALLNNKTLKAVFEAYDKTGIDDASFDTVNPVEKLANPTLTIDEQKKVLGEYFKIIETKNDELTKTLSTTDRMTGTFELYATNKLFAETVGEKLKSEDGLAKLTADEKKIAEPYLYATYLYRLISPEVDGKKYPLAGSSFNVYDSVKTDGKKYRIIILGRIDFSAGTKKTKLSKDDINNLKAIGNIAYAWSESSASPEQDVKIVGNANRTGKESFNNDIGTKRAHMVADQLIKIFKDLVPSDDQSSPEPEADFESWGSSVPWKDNPADKLNSRVELVLSHKEISAATTSNNSDVEIDGSGSS